MISRHYIPYYTIITLNILLNFNRTINLLVCFIMFLFIGSKANATLSSYMAQMDKELASTSLGSSFLKKSSNDKNRPKVCI